MKTWNVYQPILSEEQIKEVNNFKKFELPQWWVDYLKISIVFKEDESTNERIKRLAEANMYKHTYIVRCRDVVRTFPLTNGYKKDEDDMLVWRSPNAKSGSVGDIVIRTDSGEGWLCVGDGWVELFVDRIHEFESLVATVMPAFTTLRK